MSKGNGKNSADINERQKNQRVLRVKKRVDDIKKETWFGEGEKKIEGVKKSLYPELNRRKLNEEELFNTFKLLLIK